jgi:hypothetical protein
MNVNDLSLDVLFFDSQGTKSRGLMRLLNNSGSTLLTFYKDLNPDQPRTAGTKREFAKQPDCTHVLAMFNVLRIDPENPFLVRLSAPREKACFEFPTITEFSKFMDYLSQKVRIVHSELNPDLYLLQSIDLGQAPFSATSLPTSVRKPHERVALSSWATLTRPQTITPIRITSANIDTASFYNAEFDPSIIFQVFKRVINPQPTDAPYDELKKQWVLLSHRQFVNNPELRQLIIGLETQIKEHSATFDRFPDPHAVKQTLFEIILTYALYNWDGTQAINGIVDLVLPFVDAYLLQFGSLEGCAPAVFELFATFYERHNFSEVRAFKPQFIQPLLVEVGRRIASMFPELLQWLTQKHVFTLDFLRDDCSRWFVDVFNDEEVKVLWISILSFSGSREFFESFLIALLLMLRPDLNELIPLSASEFVDRFNQVKVKADLRTLLANTEHIHTKCHSSN